MCRALLKTSLRDVRKCTDEQTLCITHSLLVKIAFIIAQKEIM